MPLLDAESSSAQCSTSSPLKSPKYLDSSETSSKNRCKAGLVPEFKPYLHHPCETNKVFSQNNFSGLARGFVPGPATSSYFRYPLGVPCSLSFPLYLRRGAETPTLRCMRCQLQFWLCERGCEGSHFSPGDSAGSRMQKRMCLHPLPSDTSKLKKLGKCLFLIQNTWSGLFPAEILS